MATQAERAAAVIDALRNQATDPAMQLRIVNRFVTHWQSEFDELVADPENPTTAEKAGFFVKKMRDFGTDIVKSEAQKVKRAEVQPDIITEGDTAADDLGEAE